MKLFLTGGSGMLGRNILEHVEAQKYEILAPRHVELDLSDENKVAAYLALHAPDLVIHAAGIVGGIQANIARPVNFLVDNLKIGMNVILGAHKAGVRRVLNVGSSCMYPRNAPNPLKEEQVLQGEFEPTNEGYGLAKVTCARLCDYINRQSLQYEYKTIIPSNLYGRHDKFHPSHSHMIPSVIAKVHQAVTKNETIVDIWGDGTSRREFMYAGDLADFIFKAIEHFSALPQYLNVGLGFDYTIKQYYEAVADVIGYKGGFVHDMTKPSGMSQKLVDTTRLKSFGWVAGTSLRTGIEKTYGFYLGEISK